jgi:hypothetical protein
MVILAYPQTTRFQPGMAETSAAQTGKPAGAKPTGCRAEVTCRQLWVNGGRSTHEHEVHEVYQISDIEGSAAVNIG